MSTATIQPVVATQPTIMPTGTPAGTVVPPVAVSEPESAFSKSRREFLEKIENWVIGSTTANVLLLVAIIAACLSLGMYAGWAIGPMLMCVPFGVVISLIIGKAVLISAAWVIRLMIFVRFLIVVTIAGSLYWAGLSDRVTLLSFIVMAFVTERMFGYASILGMQAAWEKLFGKNVAK